MRLKPFLAATMGVGALAAAAGVVVACGKTANAVLPVEIYLPYSPGEGQPEASLKFRTDVNDPVPAADNWTDAGFSQLRSVNTIVAQRAAAKGAAPLAIAALKAATVGFVGNYGAIAADPADDARLAAWKSGWRELFAKVNQQRGGSDAVMVEMSQVHLSGIGRLAPASVGNGQKGWAVFTIDRVVYDGQSTTDNSPAAAFRGLLPPARGFRYEIPGPIHFAVAFNNPAAGEEQKPVTDAAALTAAQLGSAAVGFAIFTQTGLDLAAAARTTSENPVSAPVAAFQGEEQAAALAKFLDDHYQAYYAQAAGNVPNASNRYAATQTADQFRSIWGFGAPTQRTS